MNFKTIKLEKTDFKVSDVFSYEGTVSLWNSNTVIALNFPEDKTPDEYFEALTGEITDQINWLERNRSEIEKSMIEYGCISLAEDWAGSAEEAEDEDKECYIMEDGQKVFFPITEEDFKKSL